MTQTTMKKIVRAYIVYNHLGEEIGLIRGQSLNAAEAKARRDLGTYFGAVSETEVYADEWVFGYACRQPKN